MKPLEEHLTQTIRKYLSEVASANNTTLESLDLFTHSNSPVAIKQERLYDEKFVSLNESDKVICGDAEDYSFNNETGSTIMKQTAKYSSSDQVTQSSEETEEIEFGAELKVITKIGTEGTGIGVEGGIHASRRNETTRGRSDQQTRSRELETALEIPPYSRATFSIQPYQLTQTHTFKVDYTLKGNVAYSFENKKLSYDTRTLKCQKEQKSANQYYIPIYVLFAVLNQQNRLSAIKATIKTEGEVICLKEVCGKRRTPVFRLDVKQDIKTVVKSPIAVSESSKSATTSITVNPTGGGMLFKKNYTDKGTYSGANIKASSADEILKVLTHPTIDKQLSADGDRGVQAMTAMAATPGSVFEGDFTRDKNYRGPVWDFRQGASATTSTATALSAEVAAVQKKLRELLQKGYQFQLSRMNRETVCIQLMNAEQFSGEDSNYEEQLEVLQSRFEKLLKSKGLEDCKAELMQGNLSVRFTSTDFMNEVVDLLKIVGGNNFKAKDAVSSQQFFQFPTETADDRNMESTIGCSIQ